MAHIKGTAHIESLKHSDREGRSSYFLDESEFGHPMIVAVDHSVVTMQDVTLAIKFTTRCLHPCRGDAWTWGKCIQNGERGRDSQKQRDRCRQSEEGAKSVLPSAAEVSDMWAEASQWAVDQVDSVNVERLPMTKSKVDVWDLATEAFESCLWDSTSIRKSSVERNRQLGLSADQSQVSSPVYSLPSC